MKNLLIILTVAFTICAKSFASLASFEGDFVLKSGEPKKCGKHIIARTHDHLFSISSEQFSPFMDIYLWSFPDINDGEQKHKEGVLSYRIESKIINQAIYTEGLIKAHGIFNYMRWKVSWSVNKNIATYNVYYRYFNHHDEIAKRRKDRFECVYIRQK